MGNITDLKTACMMAFCLLPGFTYYSIRDLFLTSKTQASDRSLLNLFVTTMVFAIIFSWPVYALSKCSISAWIIFLLILLLTVVIPAIMGLYWIPVIYWLLRKLNFSPIHPIIWGWDKALQRKNGTNVIVTLVDDMEIYGVFGPDSLASSDPNNRDLYLEKMYFDNAEDSEVPIEIPGVYIVANQIKMIRFVAN